MTGKQYAVIFEKTPNTLSSNWSASTNKTNSNSTNYPVTEVQDPHMWNDLKITPFTSDIPEFYYRFGDTIEAYPTPSSTGTVFEFNYKKKIIDLSEDDSTVTVSFTNDDETITSSGAFTSAMVGQYVLGLDGYWYEIESFTNANSMELTKVYEGTTDSGSTTIGQISTMPDGFEKLPLYRAVQEYFLGQESKQTIADRWGQKADKLEERLRAEHGIKTRNVVITQSNGGDYINPNLMIRI